MEQVWEWRSANPEDWQQLTDSFYKAVSRSAVCAVGIINERYKEFRVQLFSDEKNYFAYDYIGTDTLKYPIRENFDLDATVSEIKRRCGRLVRIKLYKKEDANSDGDR